MDRRGLGRGLGALFPAEAAEAVVGARSQDVPADSIRPNPRQPRRRFDTDTLAELAQSIREHGILQPLLVRRIAGAEGYELIAGERRWRAAQSAGLATVPVIVKEIEDRASLEVAVIENVQREDIGPVEAARAYARLREEFGLTQEQIAKRVGKSQPTIANALRLLALSDTILEAIERGEITEGHAKALLAAPADRREALLRVIRMNSVPVRVAEQLAREERRGGTEEDSSTAARRERAPASRRDPNLAAVEEALQIALGTKVTIRRSGRSGTIEIEFYDDQVLEGIYERIVGRISPE